jgi:hypothetical protein
MPSPIAHISVGYLLYRFFGKHISYRRHNYRRLFTILLIGVFLFLSMVPDLDAVVGMLTNQMGRYHNNWTHSIIVCVGISLVGAAVMYLIVDKLAVCLGAAFACCSLHIIMDFFSYGRGVMLLWPITYHRFQPPFYIFMGLHWSEGVWSALHLLTLLNELLFVAILLACIKIYSLLKTGNAVGCIDGAD